MLRARLEREDELQSLRVLLKSDLPTQDDIDEDIERAIRAQINVIELAMTRQQVYQRHEGDEFVLNAAIEAFRWLREDDESPAQTWISEVLTAL